MAYFLKNGGKLITEDTAVIEISAGKAYVKSSYPFIKLSTSANIELSFVGSDGITLPTEKNSRKGHLLSNQSFTTALIPIDYCIFLEYSDQAIETVKPLEALTKLMNSSLNIYPLTTLKKKELFHWSAALARCIKILRFRRRKGIFLSKFLLDFIGVNKR